MAASHDDVSHIEVVGMQQEERPQRGATLTLVSEEEDGFVAARLPTRRQLSLVDALDDDRNYIATANEKSIKEIGRLLAELGDHLCTDYVIVHELNLQKLNFNLIDKVIGALKAVLTTVDAVFEYLEYTGHRMLEDVKTHEGVLRGILNFSELAFQLEIFTFLKLLVKCIDVPEDPYLAERNHIIKSLESIDSQETEIINLVEKGGQILTSIIRAKTLDMALAREFDDVIRRATLEINFCKRNLQSIEPVIQTLLWKTNTIKWFSRGVRLCCMGLSCSYLYVKYKESNISLPIALGGSMVSGFMWMSLFPSRSYKLYDSLRDLQYMNQRLNEKLEDLQKRMESHQSQKWKLIQ